MEDTVKERIKLYLKKNNIKAVDFCKSIGVSSGFIAGMRESIQPDKLKSIAIKYPRLDIGWLMTGCGEMEKVSSLQTGGTDMSTSYIGTFTKPIVTDIKNVSGDGNNLLVNGSTTTKNHPNPFHTESTEDFTDVNQLEIEIQRLNIQIEHLTARLELKDAIIENKNLIIEEKERTINLLLEKKS